MIETMDLSRNGDSDGVDVFVLESLHVMETMPWCWKASHVMEMVWL